MKKKIFIGLGIAYALFCLIMMIAFWGDDSNKETKSNKNPNILTVSEYGEEYPYTIDNVELCCMPTEAVYIKTENGEKYALNGHAMNLLKSDPLYKGNTNSILKPNKNDILFLNKGFNLCKKK